MAAADARGETHEPDADDADDAASRLHRDLARTVRDLRASRGLSLDALAHRCGVSRSMISLIERGESSPTAVVLEKLAAGLDVSLASLFERPAPADGPIARHGDQPTWRDPGSGYVRRNVSPTADTPIQLVDVTFPPRAHVAYETVPRERRVHQQVWVLDGEIVVSVGADRHHLRRGDCLALVLDEPTAFENPTDQPTRYVVALVHEPPTRR